MGVGLSHMDVESTVALSSGSRAVLEMGATAGLLAGSWLTAQISEFGSTPQVPSCTAPVQLNSIFGQRLDHLAGQLLHPSSEPVTLQQVRNYSLTHSLTDASLHHRAHFSVVADASVGDCCCGGGRIVGAVCGGLPELRVLYGQLQVCHIQLQMASQQMTHLLCGCTVAKSAAYAWAGWVQETI